MLSIASEYKVPFSQHAPNQQTCFNNVLPSSYYYKIFATHYVEQMVDN